MLNLNQILTMHCREATRLASEGFDRPLTASERIGMRLHVGICANCRRVRRQLALLQGWLVRLFSAEAPAAADSSPALSDARREAIKQMLRRESG